MNEEANVIGELKLSYKWTIQNRLGYDLHWLHYALGAYISEFYGIHC